jgi:hypothetical protein
MLVVNESELSDQSNEVESRQIAEFDTESVIRVAVEGIKLLIDRDRAKKQ